ncbi:MAG: universal stress protein [Labilithrix sp.]|nr:universal stress protein [Labilithrix sp.]
MKSILVAVDASLRAPLVLAAGVDLAKRVDSKVRLLRVVGLPPDLPSSAWAMPPNLLVDDFLLTAKRELEEMARTIPHELFEGSDVKVGVAWDTICTEARAHDCDMIVIGSHGYGLLDRLVGTTAAKVVNHADRSVLVVRSTKDEQH